MTPHSISFFSGGWQSEAGGPILWDATHFCKMYLYVKERRNLLAHSAIPHVMKHKRASTFVSVVIKGSSPFRRIGWRGVGSLFFPLFPLFFSMYRYKEKRQEKEGRQLSKSSSSLFYLTMRNATFTRPIVLIATVISRLFLSSCYHSLLPLQPSGQDNEDVTHTTQREMMMRRNCKFSGRAHNIFNWFQNGRRCLISTHPLLDGDQ